MRLALKLTTVTVLNTAVLIAACGWLSARHELALFDQDMRRDAALLARTVSGLIAEVYTHGGLERASGLVEAIHGSEGRMRVRGIVLDAPPTTPQAPRATSIRVELRRTEARPPGEADGEAVPVALPGVVGQGSGIAPEDLPHVFDPFFTRKDVGQETGLGLSTAHEIVTKRGGRFEVHRQRGTGSRFEVYHPLEERPWPDES